jgi:inorganic pyrophosphatase
MEEVLVYIEISKGTNVKYEYDHKLNTLICDRILFTPFMFPFNYGFIPNTLSGDGDPIDVLICMEASLFPGSYIKCRIIGALETEDDKGNDIKLIAVPIKTVSPNEANIESLDDLPYMFVEKVKYFYKHYKDLENKEVKIGNLLNKDEALVILEKSKLTNY